MDPAELRRRNFIAPDDFPHKTVAGATYDSGEYARALDRVLEAAGYDELRARAGGAARARRRQAAGDRAVHLRRADRPRRRGRHLHGRARTASSRSRPAPRPRARATRRRGRSSCRGRSACRWTTCASSTPTPRKVPRGMGTMGSRTLQVGGSAMINATARGAVQGPRARGPPARGRRRRRAGRPRPGPRRRRARRRRRSPWAELAKAAADPAQAARGHGAGPRRDQRLRDPGRELSRSAPTSPSSRSTRRPAWPSSSATSRSTTRATSPTRCWPRARSTAASRRASPRRSTRRSPTTRTATASPARSTSYALPTAAELPMFETSRTETPSPLQPAGRQGHRRVGRHRRHARRVERRRRRRSRTSASRTSTCRRRRMRVWQAIEAARSGAACVGRASGAALLA